MQVLAWLESIDGATLNVAGPRASGDPAIHALTYRVIEALLAHSAV